MELAELDADERIVLVALLERIVGADARVSDGERAVIERVAAALGGDAYRAAAVEADRRFRDEEELLMFAPVLSRPGARALIYETALEAALVDAIDARESGVLERLARVWHLHVKYEPPRGTR